MSNSEEQAHQSPLLAMQVQADSELKTHLVEYVGTKFDKEEVTVQMISEVLASEFPEFLFAYAEENYIRGYQAGIDDGAKIAEGGSFDNVGAE